jgi:glycosyltransferase involved in cell wall biosynthesis
VPGGDPAAIARAVESLVADPAATVAMGLRARTEAAAYGWGGQKQKYLEVVDRLVGRGRLGSATPSA